jgi:hypothetical protein
MKPNCTAIINRKIFALVARINRKIEKVGLLLFAKISLMIILPFIFFSILTAPVSGISVSYNYYDETGYISNSLNYNLDDSTLLKSISTFEGTNMQQSLQASGKGHNYLQQSIKGNSYSVDNALSSLGAFSASGSSEASSAAASLNQGVVATGDSSLSQLLSGDGIAAQNLVSSSGELSASAAISAASDSTSLNQKLAGNGDTSLAVKGRQGSSEAGQDASVAHGALSSSQSLSAGEGVSASQNTEISGLTGQVGMGALSQDRALLASGSYLGAGTLSASLSGESKGKADGKASISVDGNQRLGDGDLKDVSKDGTGLSVKGLRLDQMGNLGTFSMQAASLSRTDYEADLGQKQVAINTGSAVSSSAVSSGDGPTGFSTRYLNNPNAYVLTGCKWAGTNPQIKLYLKSNTLPNYLDLTATKNAIASAANTWDDAVAQNLFADGDSLVTVDASVQANADDNKNVVSWGSIGTGSDLGLTYYRYHMTKVDGYYPLYDSDIIFNTNSQWATNGQDDDVQSVALHELGHTIGLDDLYNKPQFSSDTDEIMHYYTFPRHTLGPGDIAGAQALYGAFLPASGASGGYSFSGIS